MKFFRVVWLLFIVSSSQLQVQESPADTSRAGFWKRAPVIATESALYLGSTSYLQIS